MDYKDNNWNILNLLSNLWHFIVERFNSLVDYLKNYNEDLNTQFSKDIVTSKEPPIRPVLVAGGIIVLIFFGIFGLWAGSAPLESAAVAPGKIVVSTHSKTIQHLEGGIIKNIFIKEGDHVKEGSPLIQLDDTQAKAAYDSVHQEVNELLATEARLIAERDGKDVIQFPKRLIDEQNHQQINSMMKKTMVKVPAPIGERPNNDISTLLKLQWDIFNNNRKNLKGQLEIFNQRIKQLEDEIKSLKAQVAAEDKQIGFIREESKAVSFLESKQLIEKNKLWQLNKDEAKVEGDRNEHMALISRAEQRIGETQQQILTTTDDYRKTVLNSLDDTKSKLTNALEREKAAEHVLNRTMIVAPVEGTVTNLKEYTVTGIIKPGENILDIVPNEDSLIAEVKVNPLDIDVVHPGLKAKIRLVAFKQRTTPTVDGEVIYVSADSITDPVSNETYFTARIIIPGKEIDHLKNVHLYPGMPVQALIIVAKRTALDYILSPIKDSMAKAFREQ